MQEKTLEEELKDLTCVNGAMYFGAVEKPCPGRETGECCHNEQTYEEAFNELLSFISSREEKAREEGKKYGYSVCKLEAQYRINEVDAVNQYKEELLGKLPKELEHTKECNYLDGCVCKAIGFNDCLSEVKKLL